MKIHASALFLVPASAIVALCNLTGCAGSAGTNIGAQVGILISPDRRAGRVGLDATPGYVLETASARRVIDEGWYLYHEPQTGKTATFRIGMTRSAADILIRAQGIVYTRRSTDDTLAPAVFVLGPAEAAPGTLVYLHFRNEQLIQIDVPA